MKTNLFDYNLPSEYIAQQPDLLVANNSRVIPARLHGQKPTGGKVEIFLLRRLDEAGQEWACLVRGRNLNAGSVVLFNHTMADIPIEAVVQSVEESGTRIVRFSQPLSEVIDELGEVPLPPYITKYIGDSERYQTIYSQPEGSAAAPTAGLHFTPDLLAVLRQKGIQFETATLHVGLDTFRPVTVDEIDAHEIHSEWAELTAPLKHRALILMMTAVVPGSESGHLQAMWIYSFAQVIVFEQWIYC